MLDGERFSPVGIDREAVAEVLADVAPGHLIQEQVAVTDLVLLGWRQGGDDEPVADVDVELVTGSSAGCVRVQPGPQALCLSWLAGC